MVRSLAALAGVLLLSGCISYIESAYDNHARDECAERGGNVSACYDDVDRNRREQRRRYEDD